MKSNQVSTVAVCCLLLLCEPVVSEGEVNVDVIEPSPEPILEPTHTLTPTPAPTGLPLANPHPTCTTMPWPTQTPVPEVVVVGRASQYAPGVMERVLRLRQKWGQVPAYTGNYDGYVAGRECADIGKLVWLRQCDAEVWEVFLIVDCASKSDQQSETDLRTGYEWMRSEGVLFEVGARTAERWNTVGRMACVEMLISGGGR